MTRYERAAGSALFAAVAFGTSSWLLSMILPFGTFSLGGAIWLVPLALGAGAAWIAWSTPKEEAIPDHAEQLIGRSEVRRAAILILAYETAWSSLFYVSHDEIEWLSREWNRFWIGLIIPPILAVLLLIWRKVDDAKK